MTSKRRSLSELAAAAKPAATRPPAAKEVATPEPPATDTDAATPKPVATDLAAPVLPNGPPRTRQIGQGRAEDAAEKSATPTRPLRRRGQPPTPTRFDEFERKETRLRDDQYEQLTLLSRKLNRRRSGRGQRITENTLIRVAIDLLLADAGKLAGITEDELRDSVATKESD